MIREQDLSANLPWRALAIMGLVVVLVAACSTVPTQKSNPAHPGRVGLWDRFEIRVVNRRPYSDPYNDVDLNVVYTRPDGSEVKFWGFYDGGVTWRLRFMPDQIGRWRYRAVFSDGSPGIQGSFTSERSDLPGMISRDETNPRWFGFDGGGHVLIRALHVGDRFFAANWSGAKRRVFLDWAGRQGYNTLSIASHFLNRDERGRGRGWRTPKLWPLGATEYRRMETLLDDLARRRMIVFPFAGFFGQDSNYPERPVDQARYLRYTIARLGGYWNVMWNVAGPEPNVLRSWLAAEDVERLGRSIRRLDPFHHPRAVHNRSGDDPHRDSDWTTYGVLQGPKTINRAALSKALLYNHHPRKPLLAQETLWSGNTSHMRNIGRDYTDDDLRKNAFVINLSAAALVFADNDGASSSGFSGSMDLTERRQGRHDVIRRVWDFMASLPFYRMTPRQDLVDHGYCLADDGKRYLVYLATRGPLNVKVEGGPFKVEWINARDTADRRGAGITHDGSGLRPPPGGDDWLVYLTRPKISQRASLPGLSGFLRVTPGD